MPHFKDMIDSLRFDKIKCCKFNNYTNLILFLPQKGNIGSYEKTTKGAVELLKGYSEYGSSDNTHGKIHRATLLSK